MDYISNTEGRHWPVPNSPIPGPQPQSQSLPFVQHNNPPRAAPTFDFEFENSSKTQTVAQKDPILSRENELKLLRLIEQAYFVIKTAETESRKSNFNHIILMKKIQTVLDDVLMAKKTMQSGLRDGEDLIELYPADEDLMVFEANQPASAPRTADRLLAETIKKKASEMTKEGRRPLEVASPIPVHVHHQRELQKIGDRNKEY